MTSPKPKLKLPLRRLPATIEIKMKPAPAWQVRILFVKSNRPAKRHVHQINPQRDYFLDEPDFTSAQRAISHSTSLNRFR
jgi:hypothetical protein